MNQPDPLIDEFDATEDMHAPYIRVGEVHVTCEATSKAHFRGFGLTAAHVVKQEFIHFPTGEQLKTLGNDRPWDEVIWRDGQIIAIILGQMEGKPKLVWVRDEDSRTVLIG